MFKVIILKINKFIIFDDLWLDDNVKTSYCAMHSLFTLIFKLSNILFFSRNYLHRTSSYQQTSQSTPHYPTIWPGQRDAHPTRSALCKPILSWHIWTSQGNNFKASLRSTKYVSAYYYVFIQYLIKYIIKKETAATHYLTFSFKQWDLDKIPW